MTHARPARSGRHVPVAAIARRLVAAAALLGAVSGFAAPEPDVRQPQVEAPRRVLFVGNSYLIYNDGLYHHVRNIVRAADPELAQSLVYRQAAINAATLDYHDVRGLLAPGRLGMKEAFQVVVLQGHSADAMSAKRRAAFREKAIELARDIAAAGARTALYMTHAYVKPHRQASAAMAGKTAELYVSVGNEIGALVIPVGLAFEEAYRRRPGLRLHQDYDGSHPNLEGTYLAACVVYASLYGRSPLGNPYDYHGRIARDTAAFLQEVAADTVRAFYAHR